MKHSERIGREGAPLVDAFPIVAWRVFIALDSSVSRSAIYCIAQENEDFCFIFASRNGAAIFVVRLTIATD